jgi:WD40 repeat protein
MSRLNLCGGLLILAVVLAIVLSPSDAPIEVEVFTPQETGAAFYDPLYVPPYEVVIRPDGEQFALGFLEDKIPVQVRSASDAAEVYIPTAPPQWVGYGPTFSADGRRVAVFGLGKIAVWDVAARRLDRMVDLHPWMKLTRMRLTSEFGGLAVVDYMGGRVRVWDLDTGRTLRTVVGLTEKPYYGPRGMVVSPGGRLLAVRGDHTLAVFDLTTGAKLWDQRDEGQFSWSGAMAFSPDGRRLVVTPDSERYPKEDVIRDAETGIELVVLDAPSGYCWGRTCVAFSPDGRFVVCDHPSGLWVCDSATGKRVGHLLNKDLGWLLSKPLHVRSIAFTPDGSQLITFSSDNGVVYLIDWRKHFP